LIQGDGDHLDQVPVVYSCIVLIQAYQYRTPFPFSSTRLPLSASKLKRSKIDHP